MCQRVRKGTEYIETVAGLKKCFPSIEIIKSECYETIQDDDCLCVLNLDDTFTKAKILYEADGMDYTIT